MLGIIILTTTACILGIILVIVDSKLNKKEDYTKEILEHLPGYNCGACGYAGCSGMCEAMKENLDNYKKCKPLRGEKLKEMENFVEDLKKSI